MAEALVENEEHALKRSGHLKEEDCDCKAGMFNNEMSPCRFSFRQGLTLTASITYSTIRCYDSGLNVSSIKYSLLSSTTTSS